MSPNIKILESAALKAGKYLSRDFGEVENLQVSKKGAGDFVTSADLKSEKINLDARWNKSWKLRYLLSTGCKQ